MLSPDGGNEAERCYENKKVGHHRSPVAFHLGVKVGCRNVAARDADHVVFPVRLASLISGLNRGFYFGLKPSERVNGVAAKRQPFASGVVTSICSREKCGVFGKLRGDFRPVHRASYGNQAFGIACP